MPFPNSVNVQPAPAVAGDFASANPRFNYDAGPFGLIAGIAGVTIGRFAWTSYSGIDGDNSPQVANSNGSGPVSGFVHREQQGLITTFLAESGMVIQAGYQMGLMTGGDYWCKNEGSTQALLNQKAYANFSNGAISFAATGSAPTSSFTAAVAASTFSVTGSIAGNVLTVTAVTSGTIVAGATISGTGIATGTQIVSQLSGTAGGIGTYAVNIPEQQVASTTVSGTYGTMTVSAMTSGTIVVGGILAGGTVAAGTVVSQFLTGTGGTGTYAVNNNTAVTSAALTETTAVETKFFATSEGAVGELVKISDHALG